MTSYKEIVTKAVVGKAKKITHNEYHLIPDEIPNTILGCWVINHYFNGTNSNGSVLVKGSFDINVWYSYDNDTKTKVNTQRFSYDDLMQISLKDDATLDDKSEIIVRSLKQPNVTDVDILNNEVVLNVEKELGIDLITLAKIQEEGVYVKEHIDFELEDSFEYSYFLPTEIRVNFKEKKLLLYFEDIHDVLYSLDFNQYGKQFAVTKEELEKNG